MQIVSRYILREFAKVFLLTTVALTGLFIIVGVAKEVLNEGIGLKQVGQLLPYVLPNALLFTLPGATLFSITTVYGKMSASNEIVAVKSLGISPMDLMWPCLLLGFLLSLATVWLNDVAWTWGFRGVRQVVIEASEDVIYGTLKMHKSYSSKQFSVTVKGVRGRKLLQPIVTLRGKGSSSPVTVAAEEAELTSDFENDVLIVSFRNGRVDAEDRGSWQFPGVVEYEVSLDDLLHSATDDASPAHLSLYELSVGLAKEQATMKALNRESAARAAVQLLSGDFVSLIGPEWNVSREMRRHHTFVLNRLAVEPYRRWANGFSCLCFTLVGIPIAIRMRNSDAIASFFACFLPILIVYYPLLLIGVGRAKNGALPPIAVWLGNVVLLVCGLWLLRKVRRY